VSCKSDFGGSQPPNVVGPDSIEEVAHKVDPLAAYLFASPYSISQAWRYHSGLQAWVQFNSFMKSIEPDVRDSRFEPLASIDAVRIINLLDPISFIDEAAKFFAKLIVNAVQGVTHDR